MASNPSVTYQANEDGSHSIGVKVGKAFVPFVTVAPGHFASLQESSEQSATTSKDEPEDGDK